MRRSSIIQISITFIVLSIAAVALLFFLKKNIAHYAVVKFLNGRGISIDFNIQKITGSEIHLTDIVLAEKIRIPLLHLKSKGFTKGLSGLQIINLEIDSVDVPTAMDVINKLKGAETSQDSSNPVELCQQISAAEIKIQLKQVEQNSLVIPVNLDVIHKSGDNEFHGKFQGQISDGPTQGEIKVKSAHYGGAFDVLCKDHILFKSQWSADADVQQGDRQLHGETGSVQLETTLKPGAPLEIQFSTRQASLRDQNSVLLQGIQLAGSSLIKENQMEVVTSLTDASKTLNFKNSQITLLKDGTLNVSLPKASSFVRLSDNMAQLSPRLENMVKSASGQIFIHGALQKKGESISGPLKIEGQKINAETEYGKFYNLNFSHDVINMNTLMSTQGRKLTLGMVDAGTILTGLDLKYQIRNKEKIEVQKMEIHYEGSDIVTNDFVVHPFRPDVKRFKAQITKLPLGKVLALGLKDSVEAEGLLSGHVNVTFRKKVPIFEGRLQVNGPGWIRYRTGNKPPSNIQMTDGPMDILRAYLYDFYYETLMIEFKSDSKYDMVMTLKTSGRNPGYLQGKPLKLNINLQQNLLASVQSMMLTYDLPNKLKERLEKVNFQ